MVALSRAARSVSPGNHTTLVRHSEVDWPAPQPARSESPDGQGTTYCSSPSLSPSPSVEAATHAGAPRRIRRRPASASPPRRLAASPPRRRPAAASPTLDLGLGAAPPPTGLGAALAQRDCKRHAGMGMNTKMWRRRTETTQTKCYPCAALTRSYLTTGKDTVFTSDSESSTD